MYEMAHKILIRVGWSSTSHKTFYEINIISKRKILSTAILNTIGTYALSLCVIIS